MKKRMTAILLSLALALDLYACGVNNISEKSLYEQGMEIISLLDEMTENDAYVNAYTGNTEISEIIKGLGKNNYDKPKAVYAITVSDESMAALAELGLLDSTSAALQDSLKHKIPGALISQVNAMGGASILAAASICTTGKTFVNHEITGDVVYLYTYENAAPVAVAFIVGEDNSVSASGSFILYEEFTCGSEEEIEAFFAYVSVDAVLISE